MAKGSTFHLTTAFLLAGTALFYGCSSHQSVRTVQSSPPATTPTTQVAAAPQAPSSDTGSQVAAAPPPPAEPEMKQQASAAPAPAPRTEDKPAVTVEMETAEPKPEMQESGEVVEAVTATRKPGETETDVEIVETPEAIIEQVEETTTSEVDVDKVVADTATGVVTASEQITERTETVVETTVVDKRTGRVTGRVAVSEKEETLAEDRETVVVAPPTRPFLGPGMTPNERYAGYAVVAFPVDAASQNSERLALFCAAYVETGNHEPIEGLPADAPRMATVWPVSGTIEPDTISTLGDIEKCEAAVLHYGAAAADQAIYDAELTGIRVEGRGPFLLAWSPPSAKGESSALVLMANLSGIDTPEVALIAMRSWQTDVEFNPQLWAEDGWNLPLLRVTMDEWAEAYGPQSLMLLGPFGG